MCSCALTVWCRAIAKDAKADAKGTDEKAKGEAKKAATKMKTEAKKVSEMKNSN